MPTRKPPNYQPAAERRRPPSGWMPASAPPLSSSRTVPPAQRPRPSPPKPPQKKAPPKKMPPKRAAPAVRKGPLNQRPPSGQNRRPPSRQETIQAVHQRRKRRYKKNYMLYYILLFFFLSVTGVTLSLTVFFNIKTITVEGSAVCTEADILPLLSVKTGDNLLRVNSTRVEDVLLENFPVLDRVRAEKKFPSELRITLTDGVPSAQLEADGLFYVISQSGRILQASEEALPGHGVVVQGVHLENAAVGRYVHEIQQENWEAACLAAEQDQKPAPEKPHDIDNLKIMFRALTEKQFTRVNAVDIRDESQIVLYLRNWLRVELGSLSELDYKLAFVNTILTEPEYTEIFAPVTYGVLDAQAASSALSFHPLEELVIPGNGVGMWNWNDHAEPEKTPEESEKTSSEASENSAESSAESGEKSAETSEILPENPQELSEPPNDAPES